MCQFSPRLNLTVTLNRHRQRTSPAACERSAATAGTSGSCPRGCHGCRATTLCGRADNSPPPLARAPARKRVGARESSRAPRRHRAVLIGTRVAEREIDTFLRVPLVHAARVERLVARAAHTLRRLHRARMHEAVADRAVGHPTRRRRWLPWREHRAQRCDEPVLRLEDAILAEERVEAYEDGERRVEQLRGEGGVG